MAKKRRRYTDEFRASTVLLLQAAGYPDQKGALTRVAQNVGVAPRTISRWFNAEFNPPPDETVSIKRFDLVEAIRQELEGILQTMPDARKDAGYRELATAFGIMVDKLQLLSGEPTEHTKVTEVKVTYETVPLPDHKAGKE